MAVVHGEVVRVKRLLGVAVATLLVGGAIPALASVQQSRRATSTAAPVAVEAVVDPQVVVGRELDERLTAAAPDELLGVFVHARQGAGVASVVDATRSQGLRVVDTFDRVGVAVAVGTASQIEALGRHAAVDYIEADRPAEYFMSTSHVATRGEEARRLRVTETTTEVPAASGKSGKPSKKKTETVTTRSLTAGTDVSGQFDGAGVSVAVIDSGVDGTHPMFQKDGKSTVVANYKLACAFLTACTGPPGEPRDELFLPVPTNDSDTPSAGGHGTHVASTAAGVDVNRGADGVLHGAAPGAKTVALSVGQAISVYGGDAGLNWVLEHHQEPCGAGVSPVDCPPIRVVNNSYGPVGGGEFSAASTASKLQDALVAEGVVVVWAAGNEGGDGSENVTNPPGQSPTPGILMVASYDDADTGSRDNAPSDFSSRGDATRRSTYPDISAPGTDITAACRPYLAICTSGEDDPNYGTIGGTSMATPHIAGIVAVLLGANPALTPGEIEDILEDTAHQFTSGASYVPDLSARNADHSTSFDKGHGLVDVVAALGRALGLTAPAGATPAAQPCAAGDPVASDVAGDAFPTPAEPSDPSLDFRSQNVQWNATAGTLTFVTAIEKLGTNTFPAGAFYDVTFTRGSDSLGVRATRNAAGGGSFSLRKDAATVSGSGPAMSGKFDPIANTITITIDNTKLPKAADGSMPVAPFADGQELTGFALASFRSYGAFGLRADAASGSCAYGLGTGTGNPAPASVDAEAGGGGTTGEPINPATQGSGALADGQTFTVDGTPTGDTLDHTCSGPGDSLCFTYALDLNPGDGAGTLTVDLSALPVADYDVTVYDAFGTAVGSSGLPGTVFEFVEIEVTTGRYFVVVQPYTATPETEFTLTASLA